MPGTQRSVAGRIPEPLARACADLSEAGPADAVAGVAPRFVARPAGVTEAAAVLAAASSLGLTAVPRGSGTRLAWGNPPAGCDLVIDTSRMSKVLEHAAGDLVVRVQAGVRLDQLAGMLAAAGQRLALDPPAPGTPGSPGTANGPAPGSPGTANGPAPGSPGTAAGPTPYSPGTGAPHGTIGGLLATGVAGPLRLRYGTPRDLAIGITVVRADGTVASSGGKVVKNVAGYDLGKLFAGSYGTLGLIAEVAFRLHPLPDATSFVTLDAADPDVARAVVAAAASSPLAPSAVELDRPARGEPFRVGVLLEGDPDGVAERTARMTELLGPGAAALYSAASPGSPISSFPLISSFPPASPGAAASSFPPASPGAAASPLPPASPGVAASPSPPAWWRGGAAGAAGGALIRVAFWAAELARVLRAVDTAAVAAGIDPAIGGSAAAGVLYAAVAEGTPASAVARFVTDLRAEVGSGGGPSQRGSVVVLHAPAEVRAAVDLWGPVPGLGLMRAIKDQFDPRHTMAPGRFAGGI
jgi:glycolate dehydrogenase FAD-binding subunit